MLADMRNKGTILRMSQKRNKVWFKKVYKLSIARNQVTIQRKKGEMEENVFEYLDLDIIPFRMTGSVND